MTEYFKNKHIGVSLENVESFSSTQEEAKVVYNYGMAKKKILKEPNASNELNKNKKKPSKILNRICSSLV